NSRRKRRRKAARRVARPGTRRRRATKPRRVRKTDCYLRSRPRSTCFINLKTARDLSLSNAQENLTAIEKARQSHGKSQSDHVRAEKTGAGRERLVEPGGHVTADEPARERLKADDAVDKIKRDRIHADPDKDCRPGLPPPYIGDLVGGTE